jgi:hypothetical protein
MNIKRFRLTQAPVFAALLCVCFLSVGPIPKGFAADADRVTDGVELVDGIQRSLEGPDVVITAGKDRTVYEYRQNGQLRLVKIVPRLGRPYYLVPADQTRGFGDLGQADMLLPQWTIIEF